MICPYCQQSVERFEPSVEGGLGLRCPLCQSDTVPRLYPLEYEHHPAVPFCIFGPTGHGKSLYVESLLTHLEKRIRWTGFSAQWMDQQGMLRSRERLQALRQFGTLPDATNSIFPTPQVIRLRNVPQIGGCQLIFYDTGGETFRDVSTLMDAGRYLRHATAVVWLFSLHEIEYDQQLSDLMTIYAEAMVAMGGNPKNQTVIVALTKGDLLLTDASLPASAREFLENDLLDPARDAWPRLANLSHELQQWLCEIGHSNVVNILREQFKAARFCILSAIGTSPDADNRLTFEPMPRGVLAPLFWLWRETLPIITVESGANQLPFFSLYNAIQAAPPNATIQLESRTYILPKRVEISKPLRIVGRGLVSTVIECADERFVIGVGPVSGHVQISGVTIQHKGQNGSDVIRVVRGTLVLEKCKITGGVEAGRTIPGDGVIVMKEASAKIIDSTITGNEGNGVSVREQAKANLRQNQIQRNGQSGVFATAASIELNFCVVNENSHNGVHLGGSTHCLVLNSIFSKNTKNGVTATDSAMIELRGNKCEENSGHGIHCRNRVVVGAEGNGCSHNKQSGIAVQDFVTGHFHDSRSQHNQQNGILLEGQVMLKLTRNKSRENWKTGIVFSGASTGKCEGNLSEANRGDGIQVVDSAAPELLENTANDNRQYGFHVTSTGLSRLGLKNAANGNKKADAHPASLFRKSWFG